MIEEINFIKNKVIKKINKLKIDKFEKAEIISAICRLNTLSIIKRAGSGHIGTSFSAMDLFVWIKFFKFPTNKKKLDDLNRNVFFI